MFLPVPASAKDGIEDARRVLDTIAVLPPTGWTLQSFVLYDGTTVRVHGMTGQRGGVSKGDETFIRNAERVADLLCIDLGFETQSGGILVPVASGEIEIEPGAPSAHQRLAAGTCLQGWAAGGGKDQRSRSAVVARILKNAGVMAPAGTD